MYNVRRGAVNVAKKPRRDGGKASAGRHVVDGNAVNDHVPAGIAPAVPRRHKNAGLMPQPAKLTCKGECPRLYGGLVGHPKWSHKDDTELTWHSAPQPDVMASGHSGSFCATACRTSCSSASG